MPNPTDVPTRRNRLGRGLVLLVGVTALEGIAWGALRLSGVEDVASVLFIGSFALLTTACVFAPARWLRHPDIAGPIADYPLLVRAICAGGGGLLWVLTYMMWHHR